MLQARASRHQLMLRMAGHQAIESAPAVVSHAERSARATRHTCLALAQLVQRAEVLHGHAH